MLSNRAAGVAVTVAFVTGLIASLALRPHGGPAPQEVGQSQGVTTRLHWRVPISSSIAIFFRCVMAMGNMGEKLVA